MSAAGGLPGRLVLIGHPVAHSLSPRLQNAALRAAGIDITYEALDVGPEDLAATLATLREQRGAGNVTVPHKGAAAALCDRLTPLAARVGAVNTFWTEAGALVGDNTDVAGFHAAGARLLGRAPGAERVAVLGAGGGAAAVLCALEGWDGARAAVYNRDMHRAGVLAHRFARVASVASSPAAAVQDATLVVNATTVGLRPSDPLPLTLDALPRGVAVLDLVYRPGETAWVRAARAAGHPAQDGLTMLVEQGAKAFARWCGRPPDRAVMWAALG